MRRAHLVPSGRGLRDLIPIRFSDTEFFTLYGEEEQCRDFLFHAKWPSGFVCRDCGARRFVWLTAKKLRCKRCRHADSVTAGTILHGTRKPLTTWFRAAFLVCQKGCSARLLQFALRLTYKVAWTWSHKLRAVMRNGKTTLDAPFPPFQQSHTAILAGWPRGWSPNARRMWFQTHGHFEWSAARPGGLGRCCQRLTKQDWDDASLEEDPWRHALESNGFVRTAKIWLFEPYSGSVGEKHLPAYLRETEFRLNHRVHGPARAAMELVARFATTAPHPYRKITGDPEERRPLELRSAAVPLIPSDDEVARLFRA